MMGPVRSRRWLLPVVGVLILVVIGGGAFGWATWTAHVYERDFDRWRSDHKPKVTSNARIPVKAFGYRSGYEDRDVQAQADGCDEVRASRTTLVEGAEKLPRIADLPVDWLSPAYREAAGLDRQRARVVEIWRDSADTVLRQMERDCTFGGEVMQLESRRDAELERADELADPKSAPSCGEDGGCIPIDAEKRRKFASALEKAGDHQRSGESLYRSAECASSSYGAACEDVADAMSRRIDADQEYVREVRAITAASSGFAVNQAADRADRAFARYEKSMRRLMSEQNPGAAEREAFKDDPTYADTFLLGVSLSRLEELLDERKAMRAL